MKNYKYIPADYSDHTREAILFRLHVWGRVIMKYYRENLALKARIRELEQKP
jgi:hypothetical protein